MFKKILAVTLTTFLIAACGGSSSTNGGGGNNGGGGDGGGGGGINPDAGGQSGNFGDSAAAENGIDGTFPVCASSLEGSFTGWIKDGTSWCIWKCPANAEVENNDGDEFGSINRPDVSPWTCLITNETGSASARIFAPIAGCPAGPCRDGVDFPRVYVSRDAGSELAGSYTCTSMEFDQSDQRWSSLSNPAAFSLVLNDDFTTGGNNSTSWSFAQGVLTIEGQRTLSNVAVGSGKFSSYQSNTALIRCE